MMARQSGEIAQFYTLVCTFVFIRANTDMHSHECTLTHTCACGLHNCTIDCATAHCVTHVHATAHVNMLLCVRVMLLT